MFVVRRQSLFGKRYYKVVKQLNKNEASFFEGTGKQCRDYIETLNQPADSYREAVNAELSRELNSLDLCPCGFYLKNKCICKK